MLRVKPRLESARQRGRKSTIGRRARVVSPAEPGLSEFTVFLDTLVFNGGMAGLDYTSVTQYKATHSNENDVAVICDWLASASEPMYQWREARKNAELWREKHFGRNALDLFILSYLRAQKAQGDSGKFKANVLSRRDTIILNDGWVN